MTEPFIIRPGRPTDHPFVVDSWLSANKHTPRAQEMLAAGIYWTEHKATVRRLLRDQVLTVACDEEDDDAILGWACTSEAPPNNPDPIVHYVYVRGTRGQTPGARRCGIATVLLRDFLSVPCTYTHRPRKDSIPIPESWQYNPERMHR